MKNLFASIYRNKYCRKIIDFISWIIGIAIIGAIGGFICFWLWELLFIIFVAVGLITLVITFRL